MSLYFLDTSALVKLYVREPGTDRLLALAENEPESRFAVLTISAVEARSAIRRRQREGDIDNLAASQIVSSLQMHLETKFIRQIVNDVVIDSALEMVDRYALRAYDAIQLGGCVVISASEARPSTFVCSDRRLLEAAQSERIQVLDPTA